MTTTRPPPDRDLPAVLAGRYQVGPLIGQGGCAAVYRGIDRLLDRPVAIKLLAWRREARSPDSGEPFDQEAPARLRREARAAAALNHPHVVDVHDIGWTDEYLFVVMEYLDGPTLAALLDREGRLPPERAIGITAQVCDALVAAHEIGLVHRDVTPGNILIGAGDWAKLTDFGIARVTGGAAITATGLVVGTPAYMSPEQVQGGPVDARSDLYSLGCCLYGMLTGQPPFAGHSAVETAYHHLHTPPVAPSARCPSVPAAVDDVVLTAMAKSPADRYGTAEEMAHALHRARAEHGADKTRELTAPLPRGGPEITQATGSPGPPDLDDLDEPDPGRTRRRLGAILVVLAVAALLALAVVLLYARLRG